MELDSINIAFNYFLEFKKKKLMVQVMQDIQTIFFNIILGLCATTHYKWQWNDEKNEH